MGKETLTHLHNALVKCIENCQCSLVYTALLDLLMRYKDQKIQLKLPNLILNCISLLNKQVEKTQIQIEEAEILKSLYSYLGSIDLSKKQKSDD